MSYQRLSDEPNDTPPNDVADSEQFSLYSQEPAAANNNNNMNGNAEQLRMQESMDSGVGINNARSEPLTRAGSAEVNIIQSSNPRHHPIQVINQKHNNNMNNNNMSNDIDNANRRHFNYDPNSVTNSSNHSLIANPYISIEKQMSREAQQKKQEKMRESRNINNNKNNKNNDNNNEIEHSSSQSGSIQAGPIPPQLIRQYSPYTPRGAFIFIQDKIQPGSIKGSIFNIVLSAVGGGILSLPYGIRYFGILGGLILLLFSGILSYYSNDLQLIVCDHMDKNIKPSYKTMSELAGGKSLAIFTQVVLLIQMFGAFISYQVAAGGLLDLVWSVVSPNGGHIYIYAVLIMTFLIMFPLSLLNSMAKLRFTSLLGITCSSYLAIVIFLEYFLQCKNTYIKEYTYNKEYLPHSSSMEYNTCFWQINNFFLPNHAFFPYNSFNDFITSFLTSFPLFIFSFVCNQYMLPIYVELQRRSRPRMQKVLRRGFSIITIMYIISSLGGFISFLFATCSNIILNNYNKHYDVVIAAIAIAVSMILTNPITSFAWRQNFSLLIWHHRDPLPIMKHLVITGTFTVLATIIALSVTDIAVVFGLLGATTYPTVGFVLPGVFFLRIVPNVPKYKKQRIFSWFLIIFIGVASFASFVYQIYTFFVPTDDKCDAMQTIQGPDW